MSMTIENNSETKKKGIRTFAKKNWLSVILVIFIVLMIASPNAKSWVLRQLMFTGIFNANISGKIPTTTDAQDINFNFQNEEGIPGDIASLRGKIVFINFWASWCPPCRAELPSIVKLYSRFKNNPNIVFLFVAEDNNPVTAKNFLQKENYNLPFYTEMGNIPASIFSGVLPTTIVLDKSGNIRYHHEGFANYGTTTFANEIEKITQE